MKIKHISISPDANDLLVTLYYEDGGKLAATVPAPHPALPVTVFDFLDSVSARLMIPTLIGTGISDFCNAWQEQMRARTPYQPKP